MKQELWGLPKRFNDALKNLGNRDDIIITQADKGGGVVMTNCNTETR